MYFFKSNYFYFLILNFNIMEDLLFDLLHEGSKDSVSLLSDESMNDILGGTIVCKKGYVLDNNGTIKCGCDYSNDGTLQTKETTISGGNTNTTIIRTNS